MTLAIFILFILYTTGCCLDGPDLKPKWKKWLGGKLERMANSLKPINYCNPHSRLCPNWVNPMVDALNYYRRNEDLQELVSYVTISDNEWRDARRNEPLAERYGGAQSLLPYMTVSGVVQKAKRHCMEELFMYVRRQGLIQFQVDEETDSPNVIVRAVLYVGKGHDNNINS